MWSAKSRETAAAEFGLAPGTLIAAGCGDTAANALGAGIVRPGMLFDVAGTASVLAASTATYMADVENRALLTMRSVIPGLWNPLAYIGGGGQALRWFRDQFFNTCAAGQQDKKGDLLRADDRPGRASPARRRWPLLFAPSGRAHLPGDARNARGVDWASPGATPRPILPAPCWKASLMNMPIT
jgi:sugar (pentulose or hexulose) kinase